MRKLVLAAVAASAAFVATPSLAQDTYSTTAAPAPAADTATAPDGTRAFGIEPYFGVRGGWEEFSKDSVPGAPIGDKLNGSLVEGLVGVNVPLGPVFIGAEGNVAKGVSGDIDWQYGAAGRFGFRAGDSGLFYGKVGYRWVNFDHFSALSTNGGDTNRDYHAMTYGVGAEVGPQDIGLKGITGNAGFRLRAEVSTFDDAQSFRPMLGVITHF